jgi:hypothetical protein
MQIKNEKGVCSSALLEVVDATGFVINVRAGCGISFCSQFVEINASGNIFSSESRPYLPLITNRAESNVALKQWTDAKV